MSQLLLTIITSC